MRDQGMETFLMGHHPSPPLFIFSATDVVYVATAETVLAPIGVVGFAKDASPSLKQGVSLCHQDPSRHRD